MKMFDLGRLNRIDGYKGTDELVKLVETHCTHRFNTIMLGGMDDLSKLKRKKKGLKNTGPEVFTDTPEPAFVEFFNSIEVGEVFEIKFDDMFFEVSRYEIERWIKRVCRDGRISLIRVRERRLKSLILVKTLQVTL